MTDLPIRAVFARGLARACVVGMVASTAAACAPARVAPELTEVSPDRIEVDQLPALVAVRGRGIGASAWLSLDDRQAMTVQPTAASLNGRSIGEVERVAIDEVRMLVPSTFGADSYDLELQLGPDRRVRLADALTLWDEDLVLRDGAPDTTGDAGANAPTDGGATASVPDAAPGAGSQRCSPGQFSPPAVVTIEGEPPGPVWSPSLSSDSRTLYFAGTKIGGGEAIWTATRPDRGLTFSNPTQLPEMVSGGNYGTPWITADDLSLYFYSDGPGGSGERDLYVATRSAASQAFGSGTPLWTLNSGSRDQLPWVATDELSILFYSRRGAGDGNLWAASRTSTSVPFEAPLALDDLNTPFDDARAFLAPGELVMYFISARDGGDRDIWHVERPNTDVPFTNLQNLTALNGPEDEADVTLSRDGEEIFFVVPDGAETILYRALAQCDAAP